MTDTSPDLFESHQAGGWVRLRTLIVLRWVAIAGQIAAIGISQRLFNLDIELGLCAIAVGMSIILNLISLFVYPENKRLSEREATMMLAFDTVQLGFLLGVTGGINNPFALLIMAPVTVAATALSLRATLAIGQAAVVLVSVIAWLHLPLRTLEGETLAMPELFALGYWFAIVVSIVFIGVYTRRVSTEIQSMSKGLLATQMALAREQKLTDLGGVVAAAAHELGTPLATIKLVSSEMVSELPEGSDLHDDATLIRDQADRCRDILRSMGRAGKDDLQLRQAPVSAVIEEAAEPHRGRGKEIIVQTGDGTTMTEEQPMILRRPELIHGLRNLVQNAVDFASSTVWVEACWSDTVFSIRVIDDGVGYPPYLLGRIGDPFIRQTRKRQRDARRPEYEGMGLGLFIAKTLLERTGAELNFANGTDPYTGVARPGQQSGAIVEVTWSRKRTGIEATDRTPILGENIQFEA
ncbi:sensor histidine kinase RegB [Sinisalibacter lacisalsi]|uniref:histidine kinase n=1 Tax=Sinisalibacter lacisalsi TaxID=1526570 RepID=A0ABQ1QAK5_9RHOB|nr:ActS/PrrB/RegB family redox-sensitive histidine kinase [Sinisalibacter lacisalsi]GGD21231.1 sensor histidine kinase RegB [Sinisalibacter lacisalsi]